jgi:hypothetical protein
MKPQQLQLPRSGPDGQPIESSQLAIAVAALAALAIVATAIPVVVIEVGCGRGEVPVSQDRAAIVADPGYRRAEGDSYLTYPEWNIVQAYADLAGVTREASESRYNYARAIATFWSSMCSATATARKIGPVTPDQRITDYIIGASFSLEMAVQGLYERTIGALTAWLRGEKKTPEDEFNQRFLEDYAAFLQQTPWYQYPFKEELIRFWRETPWSSASPVRSIERRFALSAEYGLKGLYAVAIGALASYSPADLTIMSVIRQSNDATVKDVAIIRELGGGMLLVRTPRYEAFTNILRAWAKNGTSVVEIAGNDRILTTVIAPRRSAIDAPGSTRIFAIPIQSKPGWERIGFDTEVPMITAQIIAVERQGAVFEHAYDY